MSFAATWMDLEIIKLSDISQEEKDKYITCMWSLKKKKTKTTTNDLIYKIEIDPQAQKINVWSPKRKRMGGINWESGININTLVYIKQITNQDQ